MTDCGCTNFPASLGNITFGASVGIGTAAPAAPLVVVETGTSQVGAPDTVADHAGVSTDRVRLAVGNLNAGTTTGATSRSAELLFYASNPAGTALQATFEVATDAEQNGTQSFFVYDTVARAYRLYLGPTGNLGVGTTTPGAKLVVAGLGSSQVEQGTATTAADLFGSSTDRTRLAVGNTNAGTVSDATSRSAELQFYGYDAAGTALQSMFELGTDAEKTGTQSLYVYDDVAKVYRLYLGATGNLGVGTITPTAALHVKQDTANVIALVEAAADAESSQFALGAAGELIWQLYKPGGSRDLRFARSGVGDQLTIQDGSGNVGVGTNSPDQRLHVAAAGSGATIILESTTAGATDTALAIKTPDREWKLGQDIGGVGVGTFNLWDLTAGASRLVVDTAGNVGVGTTAPGYLLDVNGTVRCLGVLLGGDMLMSGALKDSTGKYTHVDQNGCHNCYYAD